MVNQYIKELLDKNNRVIVPDFGAFITRRNAASSDGKSIVFNDILKFNDGLLVNHIIAKENIDITVALQKVTDYIQEIKTVFSQGADYTIEGLGRLNLDKKGNVSLLDCTTATEDKKVEQAEAVKENKTERLTETVEKTPIAESLPVESPETQITTEQVIVTENKIDDTEKLTNTISKNIIVPPPIPVVTKEEAVPPPIPEISTKTKVEEDISTKQDVSEKKEEPKQEIKKPETKQKPAKAEKSAKTEIKTTSGTKKSPLWLTITIWSISGLLFLSLIFMGSIKFGFIKGINLFSSDEWITTNDKLHMDLEEYNKKYLDKLVLPEINKDDNKKGAFSLTDNESTGSFDAPPAVDSVATDNKTTEPTASASSSEGSFGSFDESANTKNTKAEKTTKDISSKTNTKQQSTGNNTTNSGVKGKYVLVAGSFKTKDAADRFIIQLKQKGFSSAEYVGISNGMHITCYCAFGSKNEANAELQKLKQKGVQTWILNN